MKTQFASSRLLGMLAAVLFGFLAPSISARGWVPIKLQGTITIQSVVPIGGDENFIIAEVVATDVGRGSVFGRYTSMFHLIIHIDASTGLPVHGRGTVVQTNADGSTVTWENQFEGDRHFSWLVEGTKRFQGAEGWVAGKSVQNPDGTTSYEERGWITRGVRRGAD